MANKKQMGVAAGLIAAGAIAIAGILSKSEDPGKIIVENGSEFSYDFHSSQTESEGKPLEENSNLGNPEEGKNSEERRSSEGKSSQKEQKTPEEAESKKTIAGITVRPIPKKSQKEPAVSSQAEEKPHESQGPSGEAKSEAKSSSGKVTDLPDARGQESSGQAGEKKPSEQTGKKPSTTEGKNSTSPTGQGPAGTSGSHPTQNSSQSNQGGKTEKPGSVLNLPDLKETGTSSAPSSESQPGGNKKNEAFKEKLLAEKAGEIHLDGLKMPDYLAYQGAKKLNQASAFDRAKLGANPVAVYEQPELNLQLDLRQDPYALRNLQALPINGGFMVFDRHILSLHGIDPTRLDAYLTEHTMEGTVNLLLVDEDMKKELEKTPNLLSAFKEESKGTYIAAIQDQQAAEAMSKTLKTLGLSEADLFTPEAVLKLAGAKEKLAPVELAKQADNRREWAELKKGLQDDPAQVEWTYNLPLYGHSSKYDVDGQDIRVKKPTSEITYETGEMDMDQDGFAEYIVHAKPGNAEYGVEGYWAVFAPSAQGLKMIAFSPYGNGEMFKGEKGSYYFTSLAARPEGYIFSVDETALPTPTKNRRPALQVHFRIPDGLGTQLTGRDLAKKYPGEILLSQGQDMYLITPSELDQMADYLINGMAQVVHYDFTGSSKIEPASGKLSYDLSSFQIPDSLKPNSIPSALSHIAKRYDYLPLSYESWQKAISVDSLANDDAVLTMQRLWELQKKAGTR